MANINETINSPNQSGRNGEIPQLIVLHIADGTYAGTKSWFLNSTAQTSSHFLIAQDGRICQCVPPDKMAWCNGTNADKNSTKYFGLSPLSLVNQLGGNANEYSVSIECEGYYAKTNGKLTDAQMESLVWLIQYIQGEVKRIYKQEIPTDRQHIVGHYEITPVTRPNCPGQSFQWDALMAALAPSVAVQTDVWYKVQLNAFRIKANAEAQLQEAKAKGFANAFIKEEK